MFFENLGSLSFCTVFSTICGTVFEENEKGFWDPLVQFEVKMCRNFGSGYVSQNNRFFHVLSVSVVPSVSVECVIESVML